MVVISIAGLLVLHLVAPIVRLLLNRNRAVVLFQACLVLRQVRMVEIVVVVDVDGVADGVVAAAAAEAQLARLVEPHLLLLEGRDIAALFESVDGLLQLEQVLLNLVACSAEFQVGRELMSQVVDSALFDGVLVLVRAQPGL